MLNLTKDAESCPTRVIRAPVYTITMLEIQSKKCESFTVKLTMHTFFRLLQITNCAVAFQEESVQ